MIQEIKGTMHMIYTNYKISLLTFWAILIGIVILSVGSTYLLQSSMTEFTLSAPMYFYTPIVAGIVVTGVMPFMIKLGVTRFPIFLSLGTFLLIASILNAVVIQLIQAILKMFFDMNGRALVLRNGSSEFTINHIADLLPNSTFATEIIIDISITMLLSMVVFFISLIFYRYGKLIGFSFMGLIGVLFVFDMSNEGAVFQLLEYIVLHFEFSYFYYMFGLSIIVYLVSYIFMHRMTIKK